MEIARKIPCDSHEAPPVAVPVREALPVVVVVPVRVESRVESRSKSKPSKSRRTE